MKLGIKLALLTLALTMGCQTADKKLTEEIDKLEKRMAKLEKRLIFPNRKAPPKQQAAYKIPLAQSHIKGDKTAPVDLVVFSDYQCPFCAKVDPLLQEAVKDPAFKGKIKLVFKHFPLSFHKNAKPAAKAAIAAGEQGKFWEMSEKLYSDQRNLTPINFAKWAKEIGLDVAKFQKDLKANDGKYDKIIKDDMQVGIKEAKVRGTPNIFVGGWELKERSVSGIKNLIKEKKLAN